MHVPIAGLDEGYSERGRNQNLSEDCIPSGVAVREPTVGKTRCLIGRVSAAVRADLRFRRSALPFHRLDRKRASGHG